MSENLLERLNEEQFAAVTHTSGPLMIIAGAGTGKTSVVTQRIAWLIEQGHAKPDEILALTFTEKAATEMEERVDQLLPIGYVDLWISTFHAFCERILRAHALDIGLPHEFKLFTEVDALLMMRRNFDAFNLDYYRPRGNPTRFIKALVSHFSRAKDEMITPQMYLDFAQSLQMNADTAEGVASEGDEDALVETARRKELADAYHTYQRLLLEHQALDFADLIMYTIELFRTRPNILKKYQKQFKFILVDEFQDTNSAQYELVKLLAGEEQNITVVGDDDQSIYKFRGASLSNILQFKKDFADTKHVVLNRNYRSARAVLDCAYTLIQCNNPNRLEVQENINKELKAQTEAEGFVHYIHSRSLEDEVEAVIREIGRLRLEGAAWRDFAILVRANDSANPFITAFERESIPYRFLALAGLYTKPIILDALAWLRIVDQPHESPSFYRVLSHPMLGVSEHDMAQLALFSKRKALSLYDCAKLVATIPNVSQEGDARIREILTSLNEFAQKAKRMPVAELFVEVMKESGLLGNVRLLEEVDQQEQFGLLNQFYERLKRFEATNDDKTLYHFLLEYMHERDAGEVGALSGDTEGGPDVVNVMTVHASKGLEFRYVFLPNLVEQRFPSTRRSDPIELPVELVKGPAPDKDQHTAEERRLFYVALTRAKEGLILLSADDYGGVRKRKPSRFLKEIGIEPQAQKATNPFEEKELMNNVAPDASQEKQYEIPKTLSFTQIAAFTSCPLQYKFAHIFHVPVFGRHSFSYGKSMHNTLQRFMENLLKDAGEQTSLFGEAEAARHVPDAKELLKIYDEQWIDDWYPSERVRQEYYEQGKSSLLAYHEIMKRETPTVLFLEKGFTLKFGEVIMKGRIDRIDEIDGGVEIIDYKTGTPKTKLGWDEKRQLILYKMAAENSFDPPLVVKKLTYHYLEDNSTISFEPKEKDEEKLQNEVLDAVAAMKESRFEPTPGFHCGFCDFKDICEFSEA